LDMAKQNPDAIAVIGQHQQWTYSELEQRSRQIAAGLQLKDICESDRVALLANRCEDLVAGILAVLRSGAAFTVLDSGYPLERLKSIVEEARPSIVLHTLSMLDPFVELQRVAHDNGCQDFIHIESMCEIGAAGSVSFVESHDQHRVSYLSFTSGSTGKPKGIVANLVPVSHFIEWYTQAYQIGASDRVSMLSGLSHDPILRDIFVPLSVGAAICVPESEWLLNPEGLHTWINEHGVSIAHITPSMAQLILDTANNDTYLSSLRLLGLGGDRLPSSMARDLSALAPQSRIASFYGATETPQVMSVFDLPENCENLPEFIPVGKGIDAVQLLIMNDHGQLCSPGEAGQIVVRTPYLSLGYLSEDSDAFVMNAFSHNANDRMYRTGDKGRYRLDGHVEFLGRLDDQIKIRGFRVEPAEIQRAIMNCLGANCQSVVVVGKDPRGDDCLIAYIKSDSNQDSLRDTLRLELRKSLPEYMIPSLFVAVQRIPLSPNGKVNRHKLPSPSEYWETKQYIAPRSEIESEIADIWQTVLKIEQISVVDNFFDVGGHSLLAVQIVTRVKEHYSIEFSMRRLLEIATIEGMASYVENALWVRNSGNDVDSDSSDSGDDFEELEI
jgi:amino acid adenylation domain-containing protein